MEDEFLLDILLAMKKERPGCRGAAAFPKWSLERLLKFLNSSVFEPLERASWRVIRNKLLVLVFLNMGRRCNEIGAMSGYSWEKGEVIFKWFPDFKAKMESYFGDWKSDPPKIAPILLQDKRLCPVRAFKL